MQYKVIFQAVLAFLDSYGNNIRAVIIVRDKYACAQCCIISRVRTQDISIMSTVLIYALLGLCWSTLCVTGNLCNL